MSLRRLIIISEAAAIAAWVLLVPDQVRAADSRVQCLRDSIVAQIEEPQLRTKKYQARLEDLRLNCRKKAFTLCTDPHVPASERDSLLRAAAHLEERRIRDKFLNSFPAQKSDDLQRLTNYFEKRLRFCDPPVHASCRPERWQLVIEDYLSRALADPRLRHLRRWSEDELGTRIPGLADFLNEGRPLKDDLESARAYKAFLDAPGMTADSISIISEESAKKSLNDVNKALSDALGAVRYRIFRQELEKVLGEQGLKLPRISRTDFKTDRLIESIHNVDHLRRVKLAVNEASHRADAEFSLMIETRFPELMYISDMNEPSRWFNTASFSLPGYPPRLNEVLASFKARLMRKGVNLSDVQARDEFLSLAQSVLHSAQELHRLDRRAHDLLARAGILDSNGAFSRKTAEIIRKLPPGKTLREAIAEAFFGTKLTLYEEELILQQWKAQDLLSVPLSAVDKMGAFDKNAAVLGGDGIAGGAVDAWTKVTALIDHQSLIRESHAPNDQALKVFDALIEADANASQVIRSAPMLLMSAVDKISPQIKRAVGLGKSLVSADDAIILLDRLKKQPASQRDLFYRALTRNMSQQDRRVAIRRNGYLKTVRVGPEVVRAFVGFDKASAEAAESFLKPIEERLGQAEILGPNWRSYYPHVGLLAIHEANGPMKLYVAGDSVNPLFRAMLMKALRQALREHENVDVHFVEKAAE